MVYATLPVSDTKTMLIAEETAKDNELLRVMENMQNGWAAGSCPQDNLISRCETCQKYRDKQITETLTITDMPTAPWHKVGMDLFQLKGK